MWIPLDSLDALIDSLSVIRAAQTIRPTIDITQIEEVRSDYFDDETERWCIDVFLSEEAGAESVVVAAVGLNGEVIWLYPECRDSVIVQEEILQLIKEKHL